MDKGIIRKNRDGKVLLVNTIFFILFLVFGISWLILDAYCPSYPEKTKISEMDERMLAHHQDVWLFLLYFLAALCVTCLVISFVASICAFYFMVIEKFLINRANGKTWNNKNARFDGYNPWYVSFKWFEYFIGLILNVPFNLIFLIVWWVVHCKTNGYTSKLSLYINTIGKKRFLKEINLNKGTVISFSVLAAIVPTATALTVGISYMYLIPNGGNSKLIPNKNVKKFLTLSNNHPNVIQMYFDRGCGLWWNFVLMCDYYLNGKTSFIYEFPEFTSYINTLNLSNLTVTSNPTIYSGILYSPLVRDGCEQNVFSNLPNSQLNNDDWYCNDIKNECEMFMQEGIGEIKWNNSPYFHGLTDMSNGDCGNMWELQKRLNDLGLDNFYGMTNAKLCVKHGYSIKNSDNMVRYDEYALRNYHKWFNYTNTSTGQFVANFSQQIHQPYVYYENGEYKNDGVHDHIFDALYLATKDLQSFFNTMKKEPFYDSEGNVVGSVYDHTLINIIADHGFDEAVCPKLIKILDYLKSKGVVTNEEEQQLIDFRGWYYWNPIMMFKPFKYDVNNKVIHEQKRFNFNNDQLIALNDLEIINQNYLDEYNGKKTVSKFISPEMLAKITDPKVRQAINECTLTNPLDPSINSLQNGRIKNRKFYLYWPNNWRYFWADNTFNLDDTYDIFEPSTKYKSMFHNDLFSCHSPNK